MPKSRFQSFTSAAEPQFSGARINALRAALAARGFAGMLVPRADIFQGEYIPESENRLGWATGFTGSAGFLIVLAEKAALFVDGRYTTQARQELDLDVIAMVPIAETMPDVWLAREAPQGARIGYDPALFTPRGLKRYATLAESGRIALAPLEADPFAPLWNDRPAAPATKVVDHPDRFAGEGIEKKLDRLRAKLVADRLDALVVSECPALNWLFNIRASDVPHLPILRAFAFVPAEGRAALFVDPARLGAGLADRLAALCDIVPPALPPGDGRGELLARITAFARGRRIRLDEESAPALLVDAITEAGGIADLGPDPLALMKAQKNATELAGSRAAHARDGIALARFLAWLHRTAPGGKVTEIDAVLALEGFRAGNKALLDISFPTIAGAGPNAALPHYRVSEASNRAITPGLFLIDSGGQYRDGTTDITRTIVIGRASRAMREAFTRVLKGMIAVSRLVFPKGTSGAQIDAFARHALWEAGQDFDHGTGHGVGAYLSVHEGPQRISKLGTTALMPGMILSNEPGYYREGAFGIRIENLVAVEPRVIPGAEREMLGFETLSFVPIDRAGIVKSMLTRAERAWLDAYHAETLARLAPHVEGEDRAFLEAACRPL